MEAHDSQPCCQVDFFMPAGCHQPSAFHCSLCRALLHSSLPPILVGPKMANQPYPRCHIWFIFYFCIFCLNASNSKVRSLKVNFEFSRLLPGCQSPAAIASAAHCLSSLTAVNKCSASARLWRIPCGLKCNNFSHNSILLSHSSPLNSLHCNIVRSQRQRETEWADDIAGLRGAER